MILVREWLSGPGQRQEGMSAWTQLTEVQEQNAQDCETVGYSGDQEGSRREK